MAWRMSVTHRTEFHYAAPVAASYNEARLTPLTTLSQSTLDSSLAVLPTAHVSRYWDYWGTLVHAFDVQSPHTEMVVTGQSVVEQAGAETGVPQLEPAGSIDWGDLDAASLRDSHCEYLATSYWVPDDPGLAAVAMGLRADSATPRDALTAAVEWVRDQLQYEKGSTTVSTSAVEAWRNGRGVCQDFAHLSLAVLRGAGIPARYVSGYLHPNLEPEVGVATVGESHAWLEAWMGDWVACDPTNLSPVAERHVVVARGRDYGDVAPLKGIFSGGPADRIDVSVELTRLS